jgi:transglutaminase-like putative cysteine protease
MAALLLSMKIKYLPALCGLWFASIVVLAAPASGATNLYTGDVWALVDAKKALAAAAEITLSNHPDCDQATVEKKLVRVYRADGTGECQDEAYVKVLTEKGKRGNRTLSLSFMLPYSTEEVVKLEVISQDGTVTPVDVAANSKEAIDDSQMQMNIYDPNSRVLQVNLPKVEIGDVVHSIARQTISRSFMPGQYAEENVFEDEGYIRHISYEVRAPADRPLQRIVLRDEVPGTVHYSTEPGPDHAIIHRWEVNNVPRMFNEPSMPPPENVLQRVLVSTTPTWQDVSKWYSGLSESHLEATTPDMTNKVNDLTAGAKTDMEKIKAVFYYVSQDIRYMGLTPETNRPGFEPHDVKDTFNKKDGVCRDKAALLVSLLRIAGLNSYPVLINVGSKMDPDAPDPFFNHAIVSVELEGKYVLMDPTDEHTRSLLPYYDCDQSYLVCRPEGENLMTSPIEPPEDHMMDIKTTGVLTATGALEAKSELHFTGVNDDAYRNAFSHMKPDDQRRFFEKRLKSAMPGARLTAFKLLPQDMLDVSTPVQAQLEFSVDGMTASGSGKSMVSLPWIGKDFGVVNFILGGCGLDKRKYPMRTEVACGLKEDVSLKMTGGFESAVSMPTCPPVNDDCISYTENCAYKEGSLDCSRALKLKVVEFSPKQYLTLKQTLKSTEYDERKVPVLAVAQGAATEAEAKAQSTAAPPVQSDAKILGSHKELTLTDAHSGVYRVRYSKAILTYAGKIREAEVKVDYNPSCEEARIIHATVTSKSLQRQEIATNEINVMDAGWNASAKRYTGGKILVANLPGVDIGSTIEVEFQITRKGKAFIAGFEPFQLRDSLSEKSFNLTAPSNLPLQTIISGQTELTMEQRKSADGTQLFHWQAAQIKALPAEGQLPPDWVYCPGVVFFAGDMKDYLKTLDDTMLDRSQKSAKAAELARTLTGQSKTKLDAVKAIRDFVAKSIREAGPSFTELPLSELSAADTTLAEGYGHAADRAILLHAMLAAAGFQPKFVLASALPPIEGITNVSLLFPLPNSFESPLVRVAVDGETYYLNDTDQYAELGATSFDGKEALVLPSPKPEIIHAAKGCEDRTETDYTLSISNGGQTQVSVTRHYYGEYYAGKNQYFSELPPEERRRYYQNVVSEVAQGARPVGDLKTRFDTYPGLEQFTVDVDNYSVVDGKYLYFDLPFTPSLFSVGADRRALPLYLARADRNIIRTEIDLPQEFRHEVIAPQSRTLDVPDGGGTARIISAETPGKCVITDQFDTAPAIIEPQDYSAVLKIESTLERKSSKVFLFSTAEP